jgi:hypothetical protein
MDLPKLSTKTDILEDTIRAALKQLIDEPLGTDDYDRKVDQIAKLYDLKKHSASDKLSKDTLVTVLGNIAGILLILNYERMHVVTSKAVGFVLKPKI